MFAPSDSSAISGKNRCRRGAGLGLGAGWAGGARRAGRRRAIRSIRGTGSWRTGCGRSRVAQRQLRHHRPAGAALSLQGAVNGTTRPNGRCLGRP